MKNFRWVYMVAFLILGGVVHGQQDQASGSVTIKNSGSTNSAGFVLAINPDGSGHLETGRPRGLNSFPNLTGSKDFPGGVFDHVGLKRAIESTPNLTQSGMNCVKSVSFGFSLTVTYKNVTSSDLTCLRGPEVEALLREISKITGEANCYGFDDLHCQYFREIQSSGIDSGIGGTAYAFEMNPDNKKYTKELKPIQAKLKIFKSDGSFVREIKTDPELHLFAILPPGDYFLIDESAGSSRKPIGFFDVNNWKMPNKIENRVGRYIDVISQKPDPEPGHFPNRVEFKVTQHNFNMMALYFDGFSLEEK